MTATDIFIFLSKIQVHKTTIFFTLVKKKKNIHRSMSTHEVSANKNL